MSEIQEDMGNEIESSGRNIDKAIIGKVMWVDDTTQGWGMDEEERSDNRAL